jgi:hypothetical protein
MKYDTQSTQLQLCFPLITYTRYVSLRQGHECGTALRERERKGHWVRERWLRELNWFLVRQGLRVDGDEFMLLLCYRKIVLPVEWNFYQQEHVLLKFFSCPCVTYLGCINWWLPYAWWHVILEQQQWKVSKFYFFFHKRAKNRMSHNLYCSGYCKILLDKKKLWIF